MARSARKRRASGNTSKPANFQPSRRARQIAEVRLEQIAEMRSQIAEHRDHAGPARLAPKRNPDAAPWVQALGDALQLP
jgi:hypothetical protein